MQKQTLHDQGNHHGARKMAAVTALLLLIFVGTVSYHWLETWNWTQSFYFTVSTLATVGYGDLHPTTDASRMFTAFFILTGVSIAVAALSIVGSSYIEDRTRRIVKDSVRRRKTRS